MGEYRLRLSAQADRDMREIVEFIARDNPAAAERVGLTLLERAELLKTFPTLGRRVRGTREDRVLVEGSILIFYRPDATARVVEIKRFWHAARGSLEL
jgi:toxin ParE1/3/4